MATHTRFELAGLIWETLDRRLFDAMVDLQADPDGLCGFAMEKGHVTAIWAGERIFRLVDLDDDSEYALEGYDRETDAFVGTDGDRCTMDEVIEAIHLERLGLVELLF